MSLVFLPGLVYGFFEYFKLSNRDWSDVYFFLVLYPIKFQPLCLWKLFKAVKESEQFDVRSSYAEDKAKR